MQFFFFQAEDGIRDRSPSRGLGDVYKRQGLGCAPIYPSIIHSTPEHFGADRSQAVIGIQMASAYVGNLAMPPLFGLLANNITPALFPFYLLALLVLMVFMHEQLVRKTSRC